MRRSTHEIHEIHEIHAIHAIHAIHEIEVQRASNILRLVPSVPMPAETRPPHRGHRPSYRVSAAFRVRRPYRWQHLNQTMMNRLPEAGVAFRGAAPV